MADLSLYSKLLRWRRGLERRLVEPPAKAFWSSQAIASQEEAHALISSAINSRKPYCVARLGGVEQKIVLWGMGFPKIGRFGLRIPAWYSDTDDGASNAGIRPRTRESYKAFARLAFDSTNCVDILAGWNTANEYAVVRRLNRTPVLCACEELSPTLGHENNWAESLSGKRVLVISPFKASIEMQAGRIESIWGRRPWKIDPEFVVKQFPYLIDDDCPLSWQEVWNEMHSLVQAGDYDVALMGCGGLGLPLAAAAKATGRVGLHMGGHLQVLFGIYGQRHLEHDWHARWINDAWIRPPKNEVPKTAQRVENGCYW